MPIGSNDWEGLSLSGGRYLITAKLGEGGMGFVYRAIDQNIESEVVIKIPRQAMMDDPEFAGRFTREIRSLVKLSHPHIVKVTDVGTWDSTPFAVMQYLPGGSLEDQRPAGPDGQVLPCEPRSISRWLIAVAEALDYIHVQGYVHRDVKPGNILFDALGHAFLSDFGVAKVLASSTNAPPTQTAMTGAGMVLGTPEYMAPELIMGEEFDGRVDQYALAITAYELLCGRRPFEDGTKTKVLVLHTSKAPPPLTAWCQTLPDRLSQSVLKGLAKQPGQRYATCVELAKAVAAAAEGVVPRDDRVRLTCSACGRTGSLSAADFAKLKAGGGRASCPGCKSPIDISNPDLAAPGASSGGTMKFSITGQTGEYPVASAPQTAGGGTTAFTSPGGFTGVEKKMAPAPTQDRAATVAMSASGGQAKQPTLGQNLPTPRRGSATLIESALPPSADAAALATFKSVAASDAEASGPYQGQKSAGDVKPTSNKNWVWIASGAGAATLLVALASVAFFPSTSKKEPVLGPSPRDTTTQVQTPGNGVNTSQTAPGSSTQPASAPLLAKNNDTSGPAGGSTSSESIERPTEGTHDSAGRTDELASTDDPAATKKRGSPVRKSFAKSAPRVPQSPRPSGVFGTNPFNTSLLEQKPVSAKVTLDKVRAAPGSYSNQLVIPVGMYNLAPSQADRHSGVRKWLATERKIGSKRESSALELTLSPSSNLELEPRLAAHFDDLAAKQWKDKMAILTLWITNDGKCGLVKAEILERCVPYIRKVGYTHKGAIEYETLLVSPDGAKAAKGNDELWEQVGRMNTFANHYRNQVKGFQRMLNDREQTKLSAQMNAMFGEMMRNAAVQEQQQRQLQQRLTAPGR